MSKKYEMKLRKGIMVAKKIGRVLIIILIFWSLLQLLALQDKHERNRAIERCGGEDNIVEHYTKEGDLYFSCKVEK